MNFESATKEQRDHYNRIAPKIRKFWLTLAPDLFTWTGWAAILGGLDYMRHKFDGGHAYGLLAAEIVLWIASWGYIMARLTEHEPLTWQHKVPWWKPVLSLAGTLALMAVGWWLGSVFAAIELLKQVNGRP